MTKLLPETVQNSSESKHEVFCFARISSFLSMPGSDSNPDWNNLQEDWDGGDERCLQCHEFCHRQSQRQQQKPGLHAQVLRGQDRHRRSIQADKSHLQAGKTR